MSYTFTNTITSLPWHYVRFTFISDAGSGSSSVANGGYIEQCSALETSLDSMSGDVKLPTISMTLLNTGNMWSANIFPGATSVAVKIEVSFNSGSTYSDLFIGSVELEQLTYSDADYTETRNRSYSVKVNSFLTSLKDSIDMVVIGIPGFFTPTTDSRGTIPRRWTDETGGAGIPLDGDTPPAAKFIPVSQLFDYIISQMAFAGFAPTVSIDISAIAAQLWNNNTATWYNFSDWYLWVGDLVYGWYGGFPSLGVQVLSIKNPFELFQRLCQSLGVIPVEVYGSGTYALKLVPRFAASPTAITGTLDMLSSRSWKNSPYATGGTCTTVGLPLKDQTGSMSKPLNLQNIFYTSPEWTPGFDFYLWATNYKEDATGKFVRDDAGRAFQLFVKTGANTFRLAHKARMNPTQADRGVTGYYGMQWALFDYMVSATGNWTGYREGYDNEYNGIKSSSTISDVQLTKSVGGNTIESIGIDLFSNSLRLQLRKP